MGKTTLAASFSVHSALRNGRRPVLLISTDPAHSLSDILQQRLRDAPKPVPLPGGTRLDAWQVDADKKFHGFLSRNKGTLLAILELARLKAVRVLQSPTDDTLFITQVSAEALEAARHATITSVVGEEPEVESPEVAKVDRGET